MEIMLTYKRLRDTLFTLAIVLIVAGISYFFAARKKRVTFLEWVGFTKPNRRSVILGLAIGIGFVPGTPLADGLAAAAVAGIFQSGFIEELFFRGLIGKRLFRSLSFWPANAIQASIFASMHEAFLLAFNIPLIFGIFLFVGFPLAMGLAIGYLNNCS